MPASPGALGDGHTQATKKPVVTLDSSTRIMTRPREVTSGVVDVVSGRAACLSFISDGCRFPTVAQEHACTTYSKGMDAVDGEA
jgi:hypothetical protein